MCAEWVENLHPRAPRGQRFGGRFVTKGKSAKGGGGWRLDAGDLAEVAKYHGYERPGDTIDAVRSGTLSDGLTDKSLAEKNAINYYIRGDAYDINLKLRGIKDKVAPDIADTQQLLDSMMQRSSLSEDLVLYRHLGREGNDQFINLKPGDTVTDKGYMSSTMVPFHHLLVDPSWGSSVLMKILAPKGSQALVVPMPAFQDQHEVILARNSSLEYMGEDTDGARVFKLQQQRGAWHGIEGWGADTGRFRPPPGKPSAGGGSADELRQRVLPAIHDMNTGKVIRGRPGDVHEDIFQRVPKEERNRGQWGSGFYDPQTRQYIPREDLPFDATDLPAYLNREKLMRGAYAQTEATLPHPALDDGPLPRQSLLVPVPTGGTEMQQIEVLNNPSDADVESLLKDSQSRMREGMVATLRTARDVNGNLFVWDAHDAIHSEFASGISRLSGGNIKIDDTTEEVWGTVGNPGVERGLSKYAWRVVHDAQERAKKYAAEHPEWRGTDENQPLLPFPGGLPDDQLTHDVFGTGKQKPNTLISHYEGEYQKEKALAVQTRGDGAVIFRGVQEVWRPFQKFDFRHPGTPDDVRSEAFEALKQLGDSNQEFAITFATKGKYATGGTFVQINSGDDGSCGPSGDLSALTDREDSGAWEFHHNHPHGHIGTPFSLADISAMYASPGVVTSYAHTMDGGEFKMTIPGRTEDDPHADVGRLPNLNGVWDDVEDHIESHENLRALRQVEDALFLAQHAVVRAVADAGLINYEEKLSPGQQKMLSDHKRQHAAIQKFASRSLQAMKKTWQPKGYWPHGGNQPEAVAA